MPSVLGHSLTSLAFCSYRQDTRSVKLLIAAQVAGISPDIYLLSRFLGNGAIIQNYTHNIFFPMLMALPLAIIVGRNFKTWLFFSILGWMHCLLDGFTGWPFWSSETDGIAFYWPIRDELIRGPHVFFPSMNEHAGEAWKLLVIMAYEFVIFASLNVFFWIRRLLGHNTITPVDRGL